MNYSHTQKSPLSWLLLLLGGAMAAGAWEVRLEPVPAVILLSTAVLMIVLSAMFWSLTVCDGGECLVVRFGPLPAFGTRIPYAAIQAVKRGQSSVIDGWGVHFIPGRGWTFNLWGFDCVELTVGGKTTRVGSNDAERLTEFLRSRIGAASQSVR